MSRALPQKKVIAVLPAYRASRTLARTVRAIPKDWVDEIILVDDASPDDTAALARALGLATIVHPENRGYGGNQKTCYRAALEAGADIVIMIHPDFQYDPAAASRLLGPIANGECDAMFGSRMMIAGGARKGGMPWWKFAANIALTKIGNLVLGLGLNEYHSGYRAYSRNVLEKTAIELNSDNFVFDTEIIAQLCALGFRIGEVPIETRYFPEASMIGFLKSVEYGFSFLGVLGMFLAHRLGWPVPALDPVAASGPSCPACGWRRVQKKWARGDGSEGDESYRITRTGGGHGTVFSCLSCRAAFVGPEETFAPERSYESQALDDAYVREERGRRMMARRSLRKIGALTTLWPGQKKRLLDFGAGPGFFVSEAREAGWDAQGLEAGRVWQRYARERLLLELIAGGVERLGALPDRSLDAVTAWDVLEHLSDPRKFLAAVREKLRPGGVLALSTPRADSVLARLCGETWHAVLPEHLFYFSAQSLRLLLESSGFEITASRSYVRFFSLWYLFSRLGWKNPPKILARIIMPVNLFDEIEVFCRALPREEFAPAVLVSPAADGKTALP